MKTFKNCFAFIFAFALLLFAVIQPVLAQDTTYRLDINRDFGYGNGSDIRGNFSIKINGDTEKIQTVTYLIDGKQMAQLAQAPFKLQFKTSDYPDGWHDLSAILIANGGTQYTTPVVRLNFVSAEQQNQVMQQIFGFVLLLFIVLGAIGLFSQWVSMRGHKPGEPGYQRNYGWLGGTICRHCNRPFPIHFWSLRLAVVRFDRCDNCGKWSLVRRYNIDVLRAAEQAEAAAIRNETSQVATESDEDKLRKMAEESKYMQD